MTLSIDISEAIKKKRLVIGLDSVIRAIKSGAAEKVVVASNCGVDARADVESYSGMSGIEVEVFPGSSRELGTLCRKPFCISVLAVKKE